MRTTSVDVDGAYAKYMQADAVHAAVFRQFQAGEASAMQHTAYRSRLDNAEAHYYQVLSAYNKQLNKNLEA